MLFCPELPAPPPRLPSCHAISQTPDPLPHPRRRLRLWRRLPPPPARQLLDLQSLIHPRDPHHPRRHPLATQDGNVYFRLTGYVGQPLWVRSDPNGNLLYLDEEAGRELILTSFEDAAPAWAAAPFRPCEHESQPDAKPQPYIGPIGEIAATTALRYRSFSCADAGIESETYAPNLGLLSRTVHTFAGPRTFHLVEARVGNLTFAGGPSAAFHAAVSQPTPTRLAAALRLTLITPESLTLVYGSSQDYDLVLWNESGQPIYRWSEGQAFTQATRDREISGGLAHDVEIQTPSPLPDGAYLLEAWLTAGPSQRAFSALTPFRLKNGKLLP